MKAAILETINAPLVIADVELGALGRGQVLVKILVSGICGSQLQEIAGNKGNGKFVPHLLGHEGCGEVADVGADVTKVQKGDKVVLHWRKGDGIESDFPTYTYKGKKMPSGKVTTFSEYSVVSENRITKVPADIPNDFCALLGCGLSTALATIENEARVQPGESVMIVGLGGLGACFIKAAVLAQANPIIAVDIHDRKKDAALSLGANIFINSAKENVREAVERVCGSKGVNVIVETSGNSKSIEDTIPLLAGSGRYIMVGQPKPGESVGLVDALHLFGGEGKMIKATQGGQFSPARDIPRYIDLYRSGKLKADDFVTHRTSLENINEAIALMRDGKANRIMIDICPVV
ncbi:MAG: zinc-binding dehydrogenase [bacterium]|nr:zinc-binding dehydrogenase [bacterium]